MADDRRDGPPCINCLACVGACPEGLLPATLFHLTFAPAGDDLQTLRLADCTGCRRCDDACPVGLPLAGRLLEARDRASQEPAATSASVPASFPAGDDAPPGPVPPASEAGSVTAGPAVGSPSATPVERVVAPPPVVGPGSQRE